MTVYRLNADRNGTDSIQPYIDSGKIIDLPCPSFDEFDKHRIALQKNAAPGDIVILDTMSTMLETTRADRTLGNDSGAALWDPAKVNKFFGDKEYLAVYNMAMNLTMRALHNLRARDVRVICVCHETEAMDTLAGMKMAQPLVNPAMIDSLKGASSDVFRLQALTQPIRNASGEIVYDVDERILWLRRDDSRTAKFQVARDRSAKIPKGLPDPTMPKLCEILSKIPSWLTVYGHPGAGKSSFAVTAADLA